jgi:two-component system OmpR family response regulator
MAVGTLCAKRLPESKCEGHEVLDSTDMKKRILAVDDDVSVREALKRILEDSGYDVVLATDGADGEAKLKDQAFDLLILDLNMPGRDGWDVLGCASANHPLLPVIIITGMFDQLDSAIIPGVASLLKKPIDVLPLLTEIEKVLSETFEQRLGRATAGGQAEPWSQNAE